VSAGSEMVEPLNKKQVEPADAPTFVSAARQLLRALSLNSDEDYRHALLKRIVRKLDEAGYPRFIKLLSVVAQSRDDRAKRLLADTLAISLRKMDLPSGEMTSWGASSLGMDGTAISASMLSGGLSYSAPRRFFGPIEYLAVWFGQSTQRRRLSTEAFEQALISLITLLNFSVQAASLYQNMLEAEAKSELEGAFTRLTRDRLTVIASLWRAGKSPQEIAQKAAML
jgi:hypothetical protein